MMDEFKNIIQNVTQNSDWLKLYQGKNDFIFMNNRFDSPKTTEFEFQEEISKILIECGVIDYLSDANNKVDFPGREENTYCPSRKNSAPEDPLKTEPQICKQIYYDYFKKNYSHIGYVIQYQLPLTASNNPFNLGKIDLVTFRDNTLYLYEVKMDTNYSDTLIKSALELEVYYQHLSQTDNFHIIKSDLAKHISGDDNQDIVQRLKELCPGEIRKEILIVLTKKGRSTKKNPILNYVDQIDETPTVNKLLELLNISVSTLDYETDEYRIKIHNPL